MYKIIPNVTYIVYFIHLTLFVRSHKKNFTHFTLDFKFLYGHLRMIEWSKHVMYKQYSRNTGTKYTEHVALLKIVRCDSQHGTGIVCMTFIVYYIWTVSIVRKLKENASTPFK
jgi:hypothetical protein